MKKVKYQKQKQAKAAFHQATQLTSTWMDFNEFHDDVTGANEKPVSDTSTSTGTSTSTNEETILPEASAPAIGQTTSSMLPVLLGVGVLGAVAGGGGGGGVGGGSSGQTNTSVTPNAIIGGTTSGSLVFNQGIASTQSTLTITDSNIEQAFFKNGSFSGQYGSLVLSSTGQWKYTVNPNDPKLTDMAANTVVTDTIQVQSVDGTIQTITIQITKGSTPMVAVAENTGANLSLYQVDSALTGTIQYTLTGADAGLFSIDAQGHVTLAQGVGLNAEGVIDQNHNGILEITVNLKNNAGQSESQSLNFKINDTTEVPSFVTQTSTLRTSTQSGSTDLVDGLRSLLSNDKVFSTWHPILNPDPTNTDSNTWNYPVGNSVTLTYAFQEAGAYFGYPQSQYSDASFSTLGKDRIRKLFSNVSEYANIQFVESSSQQSLENGGADIRLFAASSGAFPGYDQAAAWAYSPTTYSDWSTFEDYDGNIVLYTDAYSVQYDQYFKEGGDNNVQASAILHEIGHALGLDHPFGGSGQYTFDDTSGLDINQLGIKTGGGHDTPLTDTQIESIMTYNFQILQRNGEQFETTQWGIFDVAALQYLYGANLKTRTGHDVYQFDSNSIVFQTIWDAGGVDTLLQTGAKGAVLDLRGGTHFSSVGGNSGVLSYNNIAYYSETPPNLAICFGVTIENATGGSGNDVFWGNDAVNSLKGNQGNDRFNDTGLGSDCILLGEGNDVIYYDSFLGMDQDHLLDFESHDKIFLNFAQAKSAQVTFDEINQDFIFTIGGSSYELHLDGLPLTQKEAMALLVI